MAKVTKITISMDRKVGDGNYGSFGAQVSQEVELEDDEDPKEWAAKLRKRVAKELDATLETVRETTEKYQQKPKRGDR